MTVKPAMPTPEEAKELELDAVADFLRAARALRERIAKIAESATYRGIFREFDDALQRASVIAHRDGPRTSWPIFDDAPDNSQMQRPKNQANPKDVAVFICGIPSSCNRLFARVFNAAGAQTRIVHGIENVAGAPELYYAAYRATQVAGARRICAVIPVRDPWAWRMSSEYGRPRKHNIGALPNDWEYLDNAYARTFRAIAELRMRVLPVSVEAFVAHPKTVAREMLSWAGLPTDSIKTMENIYDPNATYYRPGALKELFRGGMARTAR